MDHIIDDDPFESSSTGTRDEKVEPGELLEESWFFGNSLDRKTKFLRCFSDPCPSSSNYSQDTPVRSSCRENSSNNKLKLSKGHALVSTPSMPPPCMPREEEEVIQENGRGCSMRKSNLQSPRQRHRLVRAPSLPPCIGRVDAYEDAESDFALSKLIRQASLNSTSDVLPPRNTSKVMTLGSNIPMQHPRKKPERESINTDGCKEMRPRNLITNQMKTRKGVGDLESEEVQSFRDMGFTFDKGELDPSLANRIPGFQEKNTQDFDEDKVRRPHLSEAGLVQSSAPPIPNWVDKSSPKDMKTQIKFWARAVASNAH
ncbi:uncharacterized protein LOC132308582 [Cornus florida]|uniref:uncharacterized protein LOC132308582 n=1 Tax=Cornus florida TaxID=4283 RepID=UPI00289EA4F5|nr:uncharacterized protein LOC132308582 [Cornus florida]